ncbi:MAG TPA: ATP-binding cassette domain-containing protein [Candidatus Rifleibacterium sp.]|nr:ATP-binding cassette domain-containing protein [Candidatus Rifleibacterium sp.]HPT46187.1 ATP-binding cassette domain-containing protein [Candidatus Rifleibacterium sp.]
MAKSNADASRIAMNGLIVDQLRFMHRGPYSFGIPSSSVFGLSGSSGSGKTLMLRAISDLDPYTGRISLNGIDCQSLSGPEWRQKVAWLPAESLWWHETVGAHFWKRPSLEWFNELGFGEEVTQWEISRLSTGEKQRLAILRLLQHHPAALLLDEPTASLDKNNIAVVEKFILKYLSDCQGLAVWVSHDSGQLDRVAACHYAMQLDGSLRQLR